MDKPPVVVITGASSGIGAAAAILFGKNGYRVVLAARRQNELELLADEIRKDGGIALPIPTDVTDLDQLNRLVDRIILEFDQIDILFNNAGFGRMNWLHLMDPDGDIDLQLRVNLFGLIHTSRLVLPHMIKKQHGHIINMASIAGLIATPTYSIYAASKFAVRGFTQALRREVKRFGISVSGIYPGGVVSEFSMNSGTKPNLGMTTPKILLLSTEDIAKVVLRVAKKPRRMVVVPRIMLPLIWMNRILPSFVDWTIQKAIAK